MLGGTSVGSIFVRVGADASGLVTGFQRAEREIERFGSRVFFLGSRMTAGVTLPIVGAAMAIGQFGSEFDKAMTESLAIMDGVTPKIRKDMEEVARTISESSKYSAKQAAEGFYHLASAGYSAAESMKLLPITTKFAQAGVMDLAKATEYLAGAQQSLGMRMEDPIENAKEMARISDVLTEANNRALGTIEDFAQAITNKAGAQLRIYNKTVEEGTAALMALAAQNVKGRLAGQQLYMVMRDLARFALTNSDAWKRYGISVYDAVGNMRNLGDIIQDVDRAMNKMSVVEQTKMWKALGFTDRTRAAIQYFRGMGEEMKNYENQLLRAAGATDRVANNQMKAFANQWQVVLNKIQNVGIELFNAFAPGLMNIVIPAIERIIQKFSDFAKRVSNWSDATKAFALTFLGLAAAMGPVITILGSSILFSSAIIGGFASLGSAVRAVTTAVIVGAKAWNDYALAQGAVSLSQSFAWATAAFGSAKAGKSAAGGIDALLGGAAGVNALGPGGKAYVASGVAAYQARELAARQAAAMAAAAAKADALEASMLAAGFSMSDDAWLASGPASAAASAATMKMLGKKSKLVLAEQEELLARARSLTGAVAGEAAKQEGIVAGIINRTLSILSKIGVTGAMVKLGGWFTAIVSTVRFFSDSWGQAFNALAAVTMPTIHLLIGFFDQWEKEFGDLLKLVTGTDAEEMKDLFGSFDEWNTALSDLGTVGWESIHFLVTEMERFGFTIQDVARNSVQELIRSLTGLDVQLPGGFSALDIIFPWRAAARKGKQELEQMTGGKSVPEAISLWTYRPLTGLGLFSGMQDAAMAKAAADARAAFDKQMGELYGAAPGLPYVAGAPPVIGQTPWVSGSIMGQAAPVEAASRYVGPAYAAMGGTGRVPRSTAISGLLVPKTGFETKPQLPEMAKEWNKIDYRLRNATSEERQAAFTEMYNRYQAQLREGAYPEGLQKPVQAPRMDRNLESQKNYYAEYTEGQSNDLKNMAAAATWAAQTFFDAFPDATEIPLQWSERMWEDYKKFKDTLDPSEIKGNIKVLDDLTASFWKQEQVIAEIKAVAPYGYWGTMAEGMEGVDKKVKDLVKSFDDLGMNNLEQVMKLPTEFFQDNQEAIGELASYWATLPEQFKATRPEITALIARFNELNKAGKLMGDSAKKYFTDLMIGLSDMSRDASAKLQDAESQLETFLGGQFANKQMKYLKQTWSNSFDDIQKKYMEKAREIAAIPIGPDQEVQTAKAWEVLETWRRTMTRIVEMNVRMFRASWAQESGFSEKQQRQIAQMPYTTRDVYDPTTGEKTTEVVQPRFDALKQFIDHWRQVVAEINKAYSVLSKFGALLTSLGAETLGGVISAFSNIGSTMISAGDAFVKAFPKGGPKDWVAGIGSIIDMAATFVQAYTATTRSQRAAGGAAAGAMAGAAVGSIIPGIGTALGAGIGGIAGFLGGLFLKDPGWKQIMGRVGHDYGTAFAEGFKGISEELAKSIEEDAKKLFKGDWAAAEIYNIGAIMEDTGGVNTDNLEKWTEHMSDIFSMLETGKFTMTQATTAFDKGFAQIAQAVIDSDRIASPAFLHMIDLAREFGLESKALADFIAGQFTRAMTAWAKIVSPLATWAADAVTARKELADFNKEMEEAGKYDPRTGKYTGLDNSEQKRLDELNKTLKGMKFTVADVMNEFAAFNAEMEKAGKYDPETKTYTGLDPREQRKLDELNNKLKEAKENTAAAAVEAERMGRLLMAAFNGAIKSGMSFFDAMDQVGSNLDILIQLYKDLGITSDNAALNALMHYRELYTQNADLVEGVRALNEMTLALSNMGVLSAETLADLEAQGLQMYDRMIEAGFTETETLAAMLPWLRNVFDAHVRLGIPIDENTQALIDQANKLGLLEDNDPTSILKQGFKDLIQAVKDLTDALLGIPKRIDSDVNINYRYNDPGRPYNPDVPPGRGDEPLPQAFGGSYWVTQPTMFLAGEAGPEQVVFSGSNIDVEGRWGSPERGSGSSEFVDTEAPSTSFTFNIQALDPLGMKKVVEDEIAPLLVSVYRRNVSGLRTDTRRELLE